MRGDPWVVTGLIGMVLQCFRRAFARDWCTSPFLPHSRHTAQSGSIRRCRWIFDDFSWFSLNFHWFLWFYETFFAPNPMKIGQKTMDFHETLPTLTWCSSELRRFRETLKHNFNTYSRRSRDCRAPISARMAGRHIFFERHSEIFQDFQVPGHWPP